MEQHMPLDRLLLSDTARMCAPEQPCLQQQRYRTMICLRSPDVCLLPCVCLLACHLGQPSHHTTFVLRTARDGKRGQRKCLVRYDIICDSRYASSGCSLHPAHQPAAAVVSTLPDVHCLQQSQISTHSAPKSLTSVS